MKKMLSKLVVYVLAAMLLLPCMPVLADSVASITWETDEGVVALSDTPDGRLSAIVPSMLNNVEVSFSGGTAKYATLLVVPVKDGKAEAPTPLNAALVLQLPVEEGKTIFRFQLKPSINNGVYALYVGGTNVSYVTKYFEVSNNIAPGLTSGQILQYDDYKNRIMLNLDVTDDTDIAAWAAEKEKMSVTLNSGDKSVAVASEDVAVNTNAGTILIDTSKGTYNAIFPAEGAKPEGNVQQTTISITHPEYWGDTEFGGPIEGTFGLVIPEFSAEGFKQGVDFEIELYSENALSGADAIVALFDDGLLVSFAQIEDIAISAGETKTIPITMQSENLRESGKFSLKAMLWDGFSAEPLTSFVLFP